jgi:hypothetical protein
MEYIKKFEKRIGVDVGYHESNIFPPDRESCVGRNGIDKSLTLDRVIALAYKINPKPNIIIKAGPNAKWYLKRFPPDVIEREIEKQKWRDVSRCTMYIIEWDI